MLYKVLCSDQGGKSTITAPTGLTGGQNSPSSQTVQKPAQPTGMERAT